MAEASPGEKDFRDPNGTGKLGQTVLIGMAHQGAGNYRPAAEGFGSQGCRRKKFLTEAEGNEGADCSP